MTSRSSGRKPTPVVELDGSIVRLTGFRWSASPGAFNKLMAAGATAIGQATPEAPGEILFGTVKQAQAFFHSAFACETHWDDFVEAVPIEAQWRDAAGLGEMAKKVVLE